MSKQSAAASGHSLWSKMPKAAVGTKYALLQCQSDVTNEYVIVYRGAQTKYVVCDLKPGNSSGGPNGAGEISVETAVSSAVAGTIKARYSLICAQVGVGASDDERLGAHNRQV